MSADRMTMPFEFVATWGPFLKQIKVEAIDPEWHPCTPLSHLPLVVDPMPGTFQTLFD